MNERLSRLYHGVAVHATADLEYMAALELLVLVMLADRHVDQEEVDTIRAISEDWRGGALSRGPLAGCDRGDAQAADAMRLAVEERVQRPRAFERTKRAPFNARQRWEEGT